VAECGQRVYGILDGCRISSTPSDDRERLTVVQLDQLAALFVVALALTGRRD
jgi:hypothetical protein